MGKAVSKPTRYQTLSMCRFCTKDFPQCGAEPVFSKSIALPPDQIDSENSVIACNEYESPVEILKKKFH